MKRRHVLLGAAATTASTAALGAGWRVFGPDQNDRRPEGEPVRLASIGVLNRDDDPHEVTVSVSLDGETLVERTLHTDADDGSPVVGNLPAEAGRYRVRATLDGETSEVGPRDYRGVDCASLVVSIERDGRLGPILVAPRESACESTTD